MGQPGAQMIAGGRSRKPASYIRAGEMAREMNDAGGGRVETRSGRRGFAPDTFVRASRRTFARTAARVVRLGCFHLFAGLPTVLHLAVNPLMSILSVALPRQSLGEGGPASNFSRNARIPLAAPCNRRTQQIEEAQATAR